MAYNSLLLTSRDRLRAVLGDVDDPPGFSHLSNAGNPLLTDLSEAAYDALIDLHGAQKAGVILCGRVISTLPGKYSDGDASEDLTTIVAQFKQLRSDLLTGVIDIDGAQGAGTTVAAIGKMKNPDLTPFQGA